MDRYDDVECTTIGSGWKPQHQPGYASLVWAVAPAAIDPKSGFQIPAKGLLALILLMSAMAALLFGGRASALPPSFPNNLVVFPDRDFISAEGFEAHVGESALVQVTRPGVGVIGSAMVDMAAGGVPFEINHPGGFCWGTGTSLKVTPDIQGGDIVSITFADGSSSDVLTQDAYVTTVSAVSIDPDGQGRFTVKGHISSAVNKDNTEQRIVNPELTGTAVGRRDVRAVPGPLEFDSHGQYQSMLQFGVDGPDTFRATYIFIDPSVATIAATGGGERLLSWQVTDEDANRQGITIAEFGEVGGPGMGGCPNGPLQSGPVGPTDVVAALQSSGNIVVNWTPAAAVPGTPAITGYRVHAVAQTMSNNQQVEIGRWITGQAMSNTTITGLSSSESYEIYIVSLSGAGETFPAVHATPQTDITPPVITANPAAGAYVVPQQVKLTANEPGTQIFFTTDGADPLDAAGDPTLAATQYTAPITIAADTALKFAAFDPSGNVSVGTFDYVITNTPTPAAPTFEPATVGKDWMSLAWTASDPSITKYGVQLYTPAGAAVGSLRETSDQWLTINGLTIGATYDVTVKAENANGYGPESAKLRVTLLGAVIAKAGPDQTVTRGLAPVTVNLNGTGSTTLGATYVWEQVLTGASDPDAVTLMDATTLAPSFSLPLYAYPMTNNPLTFRLTVTTVDGSAIDEVRVTPVPDQITIASARWRSDEFRVTGTGSLVGASLTVHRGALTGPVLGHATVLADGTFELRLRGFATPMPSVKTVTVESTAGGTTAVFTVAVTQR